MVYYNSFLHQPSSLKHLGRNGDLLPAIFSEHGVQRAFGAPEINQKAKYIGSFLCHAEKSDLRKNLFWLTVESTVLHGEKEHEWSHHVHSQEVER